MAWVTAGSFEGQDPRRGAFEPGEELGVAEQAVFQDLGVAADQFAARQGVEDAQIGQHQAGLVKRSDQVLAARRVDRGLAAHRGIDLSQQGGRNLHEADAALIDGRRETGEVADHAAAEGDDQIAAIELEIQQPVAEIGEAVEALGGFARRDDQGVSGNSVGLQSPDQPRPMQGADDVVHDDGGARPAQSRPDQGGGPVENPMADDHVIGPIAEADGDGGAHGAATAGRAARARMMASTAR